MILVACITNLFYAFFINTYLVNANNVCVGEKCDDVLSMPLLDAMKATLKAELDVREMNSHLRDYIKKEVEKGVKAQMESLIARLNYNDTEGEFSLTPVKKTKSEGL